MTDHIIVKKGNSKGWDGKVHSDSWCFVNMSKTSHPSTTQKKSLRRSVSKSRRRTDSQVIEESMVDESN